MNTIKFDLRVKHLVPLVFCVGLLAFPVFANIRLDSILIIAFIYSIFAASWDLIAGYAGQINLGPVFTFGVAGFTLEVLSIQTNLPLWSLMILAVLVGTVSGYIIAIPSLRLRGQYFAIFSFVAAIIAQNIARIYTGEEGLSNRATQLFGGDVQSAYYFGLLLLVSSVAIMYIVGRSTLGLRFKAVREDETVVEVLGINPLRYKFLAFTISAFFASVAGVLQTAYIAHVDYNIFSYNTSFMIMAMTIVGGFGSIIGPVVGAFLLYIPEALLIGQGVYGTVVYGALLVIVLVLAREGLVPNILRLVRKLRSPPKQ